MAMQLLTIFLSLCVGLVGGWWAHMLAKNRDTRNRRIKAVDELRNCLGSLRGKLRLPAEYEDTFYKNSLPALSEAIERFRPYATRQGWSGLSNVWAQYSQIDPKVVERSPVKAQAIQLLGVHESADQILSRFLDQFDKCVTEV